MGMGYGANFTEIVEQATVEEICPVEFANLQKAIEKSEDINSMEELAQGLYNGDDPTGEVEEAYEALCKAFEDATELPLGLDYHDSDDRGGCYDDVNGLFWWVNNVYEMTPAAKKLENKIKRKFFVTFG